MSELSALLSRRTKLHTAIDEARKCKEDIVKYGSEGAQAATYASMWAAIMMVTDIVKIGVSAADPPAAFVFKGIDMLTDKADKLMQLFGSRPMTKKEDLLKQVDANLQNGVVIIGYIKKAKDVMAKFGLDKKLTGQALENFKHLTLVAELGVAMADDTLVLMQAGQLQSNANKVTQQAIAGIDRQITNMVRKVAEIDRQIAYMIYRADRAANIA